MSERVKNIFVVERGRYLKPPALPSRVKQCSVLQSFPPDAPDHCQLSEFLTISCFIVPTTQIMYTIDVPLKDGFRCDGNIVLDSVHKTFRDKDIILVHIYVKNMFRFHGFKMRKRISNNTQLILSIGFEFFSYIVMKNYLK